MFPGSVHPSGETIEFEHGCDGDPGQSSWTQLHSAGVKIATATLLSKSWKEDSRHRLALAASGFLLTLGWDKNALLEVIRAVCSHANDPELADRLNSVETTYELVEQRKPVSGRHDLENSLGSDVVSAIQKWSKAAGYIPLPSPAPTTSAVSDFDICTDAGAADALAETKRGELIYRDDTDTWFKRDGQVFRPISYVQVQGEAKQFMQERVGSTFGSNRSLLSKAKIDSLLALSRHHFRVDPGSLNECRHLVGCEDGKVLDLESQTLVSDTNALVTKTLRCAFDPKADCPEFKKFLSEIFAGNQALISFVHRALGYSLSGYVNEQCLFLLNGSGSNGKSTLLATVQHMLGDYAATTPAQTLMVSRYGNEQTNDLAKLVGVRFVAAAETENGQRLAESKIKRITGGDRIACRELYKNLIEYEPHFKIWLATNDLPQFSGGDYSIGRRLRVIKFLVTFDEAKRDHGLQDRLLKESSGILNWALQGYADWRIQGLNPPPEVLTATQNYQNVFGKELRRCGFQSIKGRSGNGWRGVRLRADSDDENCGPQMLPKGSL